MFNGKKKKEYSSVLTETYVPRHLPRYGQSLDTFITGNYRLLDTKYIDGAYTDCEDKLTALVQTGDQHTSGEVCDAFVDGQMAHLEAMHQEDVAMHDLQIEHIRSGVEVRKGVVERRIAELDERRNELCKEIEPLRGLRTQFQLKLGPLTLSLGAIVTVLAMVVDALLNWSYLQGVLTQAGSLLWITVLCMSFMSDGSMFVVGNLISRKNEKFMSKWLYYTTVGGLIAMFLLSVIAGVMIRFGSMDVTYGTVNAAGEFVGKESYSMAEWGVSLVTAFLTTCTGLASLAFSVDHNAHLVARRKELESSLKKVNTEYAALVAEKDALDYAVDPAIRDLACRKAAEDNMQALGVGLKHHVRKLLALHQKDADYTDSMGASAKAILPQQTFEQQVMVEPGDNIYLHTNNNLEEAV